MRPSRLFLWLCLAALAASLIVVLMPTVSVVLGLLPFFALLSGFVIDWVASVKPRKMEVAARIVSDGFVGETALFETTVKWSNGRVPSKLVSAADWPSGISGPQEFALAKKADAKVSSTPVVLRQRGTWLVEHLWLKWSSQFGLIEFLPRFSVSVPVAIAPNIRPVTSGAIDLQLQSSLFGAKATQWRGEGADFHQLSDFVAGMDPRSVDWKHSARHQKLIAREMHAERNHQIVLALDNGRLMRERIGGLAKIDHVINAALALSWAGLQAGDLVGLFAFDARPRFYAPPAGGQKTFGRLRAEMAGLDYTSIETNHTLALSNLHQRLGKRSLIVVLSDFVDATAAELLIDHMAILKRHHVIVFVSLTDPAMESLSAAEPHDLDDVARSVSTTHMLNERKNVLDRISRLGIDVVEAEPGAVTPQLVSAYLKIKTEGTL